MQTLKIYLEAMKIHPNSPLEPPLDCPLDTFRDLVQEAALEAALKSHPEPVLKIPLKALRPPWEIMPH